MLLDLYTRLRESGEAIEAVAKETLQEALKEEAGTDG